MTINFPTADQTAAYSPERLISQACRVLAHRGLAEDILGHVSLRDGEDALYVRSRGPNERGLLFTDPDDVRLVGMDGDCALPGGYQVPNELPIHREVLRAAQPAAPGHRGVSQPGRDVQRRVRLAQLCGQARPRRPGRLGRALHQPHVDRPAVTRVLSG